jgi:hypothetical protein
MITRLRSIISTIYDKLGDPRTKNAMISALLLMSAFGVIAPAKATALRDLVLSMVGVQ